MDPSRFDEISRTLAERSTRREAVRRGGLLAAVAGAFGLGGARAVAQDDPEEQEVRRCQIAFRSVVGVGPNEGARFEGLLTLQIAEDGRIDGGSLESDGGRPYKVVGQAVGRAIDLRIQIGEDRALALSGVGERDVRDCRGKLSGTFGGPELGDLGTWQAERLRPGSGSPTAEPDEGVDIVDEQGNPQPTPSGGGDGDATGGGDGPAQATATPCAPESCADPLVWNPETCACACSGGGERCGEICCPVGGVCDEAGGSCTCPAGTSICGSTCVADCPPGSYRDDATCTCVAGCPSGQLLCDGACVGPCGGSQKLNTTTCLCDELCPSGQELCAGTCMDIVNDAANCGSCGNVCPSGMPCIAGSCTCPATTKYCANVQMCKDENAVC